MTAAQQTLFIVATPIGNKDDISLRAIDILRSVDRIYAEDTRHSSVLLRHHGIATPVVSLHEHNEEQRIASVVAFLQGDASAALISDAGTPLISDPGYKLVRACIAQGLAVSPLPGASALTAALSVCGLPTDRFQFVGFPPAKESAREQWLTPLASQPHTIVLFEARHRILATLATLESVFGAERHACVARELTKRFETLHHGSIAQIRQIMSADDIQSKGEFVIVLAGYQGGADDIPEQQIKQALAVLLPHVPIKVAVKCVVELLGVSRKPTYDLAVQMRNADSE
jgi:16S rRNA (cytidine1402-2'-O)-methyltransferase